jgi:lipopolysaccharide transport system permease protein
MKGNVLKPIKILFVNRKIFWKLCLSNIKGTYAGSALGALWLFLGPLIFFGFYTLVYTVVFPFKPQDLSQMQYVIHVFCGISLFLAFSSSLSLGCTSIIANKVSLLNTVLPAQLLPIKSIIVPLGSLLFSISLILVLCIFMGNFSWAVLYTIPILISFIMMLIGLVWVVSLLAIVFRDIQQIIVYVTMFLLLVSPIAYTQSMIPSHLKLIIYLNPLSYYIIPLQEVLVQGTPPSASLFLSGLLFSLWLFSFGFKTFEVAKKVAFDYV